MSAVERVEFTSDRMTYTVLRSRWCYIIVFNVHVPREEKSDDSKGRFMRNYSRFFLSFSLVPYENYIRRF